MAFFGLSRTVSDAGGISERVRGRAAQEVHDGVHLTRAGGGRVVVERLRWKVEAGAREGRGLATKVRRVSVRWAFAKDITGGGKTFVQVSCVVH